MLKLMDWLAGWSMTPGISALPLPSLGLQICGPDSGFYVGIWDSDLGLACSADTLLVGPSPTSPVDGESWGQRLGGAARALAEELYYWMEKR